MGLDVVERPIVHINEEATLKAGMVMTVHPQFVSKDKGATVWFGDTYLITEGDAEVLTKANTAEVKYDWLVLHEPGSPGLGVNLMKKMETVPDTRKKMLLSCGVLLRGG